MISIIMPAYNAEKNLKRSINSIVNQTYEEWELIVVNDGSKDNTQSIIDSWIDEDSRIKSITIPNSGPSKARSVGMQIAIGEYIAFCDSDDEMAKDMLEHMVAEISPQVDMVVCSFGGRNPSKDEKKKRYYSQQEALFAALGTKEFGGYLWNKLFKKSIISDNNISFEDEIFCCEDLLFVVQYLVKTDRTVFIPEKLYIYTDNPESLTNEKFSWKKISSIIAREKITEVIHHYGDAQNIRLSDCTMLTQAVFAYRQIKKHMVNDNTEVIDSANCVKYYRIIKGICKKYGFANILYVKSTPKVKLEIIRLGLFI